MLVCLAIVIMGACIATPLSSASEQIRFLSEELWAEDIGHGTRTLLAHLTGVGHILESWGSREVLASAGRFHSVYGTAFFRSAPLEAQRIQDRDLVRSVIGKEAEHLAFLFCNLDRTQLVRSYETTCSSCPAAPESCSCSGPITLSLRSGLAPYPASIAEVQDLVAIMWANEAEMDLHRSPQNRNSARQMKALAGSAASDLLPPAAILYLKNLYSHSPAAHSGRAQQPQQRHRALDLLFGDGQGNAAFKAAFPDNATSHTGPVERLAPLLPGFSVQNLVHMQCAFVQAHGRLVGEGNRTNMLEIFDREQILPLYHAGWTIYFHSLWFEGIDEWIGQVDKDLGIPSGGTRISAWASKHGPGVPVHFDGNDNIVIQAAGTKRWRYAPNFSLRYPTAAYILGNHVASGSYQSREAPPAWRAVSARDWTWMDMTPGTVLFMPRGTWHAVETLTEESLHFNIQLGLPTFVNLVDHALKLLPLNAKVEMRSPVMEPFDDAGKLRAHVKQQVKDKILQMIDQELGGALEKITKKGFQGYC